MPVSSVFLEWREAEHASLHAQTALYRALVDHWIGGAPGPDALAVDRASILQVRAHALFLQLMSDMQVTVRALTPATSHRRSTSGRAAASRGWSELAFPRWSEPLPMRASSAADAAPLAASAAVPESHAALAW